MTVQVIGREPRMREQLVNRWGGRKVDPTGKSPFGQTDKGHQDFRGVDLSGLVTGDWSIKGADFSYADCSWLDIAHSTFEDCIFDRASLRECNMRTVQFKSCRFHGTDLRSAGLGIDTGLFDQCIFERVRTARAGFHNPVFQGIQFNGKEWSHLDFSAAGLWDCTFVGQVRDVMFRGNYQFDGLRSRSPPPVRTGLHRVSFENAELLFVGFTDECALEDVILPKTGTAFLCRAADLIASEEWLRGLAPSQQLSEKQRRDVAFFFDMVRTRARSQSIRTVSKHDIVSWAGEEQGPAIYDLLRHRLSM